MVTSFNPVVVESPPLGNFERPALAWRQAPPVVRLPTTVEDRIRRVFELGVTATLPLVRQSSLRDYHAYLATFLSFQFQASYWGEAEPLVLDTVIATGLCNPARIPLDSTTGILCEVVFRNATRLPLALLKVDPRDPNFQMIDDYWHWFWNCR